jgi:uncharacterized protein YndB with AHSA1/START domain
MNDAALKPDTQDIVVDEVFPHTPETIWKTLTTANLMGRWLMMPAGFEPVEGKHFTYQTRPAGAWDGGHEGNVGYGSRLDTVVTFILSKVENGTRLRLIHSGFVLPNNDAAFKGMSEGWKKVVQNIGAIVDGKD